MRWVILLRGVNVGGHNILKMAEFKEALEGAGFANVQTYIQSGNAVVSTGSESDVAAMVEEMLRGSFGLEVPVLCLRIEDLHRISRSLNFEGDPSRIYMYFCIEPLPDDFDATPLRDLMSSDDELKVTQDAICYHAPNGVGRSKLAEKIEKLVPVGLTARNLRTVGKLIDLADRA